jgi:hypothetical protein
LEIISRRTFIKGAIIAGTTLTALPTIFVPKSPAAWARKTIVHPNVNNLRVVGITDPRMTKDKEVVTNWARQDQLVAPDVVSENIDKLACALLETRDPKDAWRGIFIKPPGKSWSDTVVAIKTNHIAKQHTRSAVIAKICHTFTEIIGVKSSNIYIYDGTHGSNMSRETPFAGLPKGCKVVDRWGGTSASTAVYSPWSGGKSECVKSFVNGTVDILVNISMCKGHDSRYGGFTMTMKNHMGTFSPGPIHRDGDQDYLIAVNQTPEIMGAMDKQSGKVLFPRQQLCLVDALWASKGGPDGLPSHQPNFLAMGVFSPVVDYILATRFRGEKMGWTPNKQATRRFLEDFGYNESDLPNGGKIIEI